MSKIETDVTVIQFERQIQGTRVVSIHRNGTIRKSSCELNQVEVPKMYDRYRKKHKKRYIAHT